MSSERARSRMIGLSLLALDQSFKGSLRKQLYIRLRDAIDTGRLRGGSRIPSTRTVAASLAISRATVADVFGHLLAENYLVAKHGSGTYVAPHPVRPAAGRRAATRWERASMRGRLYASGDVPNRLEAKAPVPFQPGIPALDHFPFDIWSRLAGKVLRRPDAAIVSYGDPAGYRPLREAIAAYVRSQSGIVCDADQIVVVGGAHQALDLVCKLAIDLGDDVWLEDPASSSVRARFAVSGARVVPIPVDGDGLSVETGRRLATHARLAHVTSAHQWPIGVTLSPQRRRDLLAWADDADAWVVEEEYDGIFRYDGGKPETLAFLDRSGRVVSIGSFSVTTFPAVRIGYLIAPPGLVDAFVAAKSVADRQTSTLEQAILAEFMYDGHYMRHVHRMGEVYAERRARLGTALGAIAGLTPEPSGSGMHLLVRLPDGVDDRAAADAALQAGVVARPLSPLCRTTVRQGLILGFAVAKPAEMDRAVRSIRTALRTVQVSAHARTHRAARDVPG